MARYVTTEILGSQCIGDSRTVINTNFENLDTKLQTLSTNTLTLSTTPTIQFTEPFNSVTRRIAAFVRPTSIDSTHLASEAVTTTNLSAQAVTTDKIAPEAVRYSQLASWQALSGSPTLSAEAVQPRLAKAWVNFNGTGTPVINSSYNVSSITDIGTGQYQINFTQPMQSNNYCVNITGTFPSALGAINACAIGFESQTSTAGQIKYKTINGVEVSYSDNGANDYLDVFTGNVLIFGN